MPSTRRINVRESWRQPVGRRSGGADMEQPSADTNGCDTAGPVSLVNHNDLVPIATKSEPKMAKSLTSQDGGKKPRQAAPTAPTAAANNTKNRSRRNANSTPANSNTTSPPTERTRTTRNPPPTQSPAKLPEKTRIPTAAERKAITNSKSPVATAMNSSKKPPTLALPISGASPSTGPAPTLAQESPMPRAAKSSPHIKMSPQIKSHKRAKRNSDAMDLDSGRASKRVRLQHQPFQSPPPPTIIPAILRQQVIKAPEDKIVVFNKGEFLAVRNETGSFFVCRTAQNVYKSSKRFKIQWMSDKDKDMYIPDFYDQTDFECVLTNLRMKRVDKNKFQLPKEERQRTLNILQRALNVENGMDITPMQVTTDGVDVSIVGKEDEEVLRIQQESLKKEQKTKISQLRSRAAKRAVHRGRPKRPVAAPPPAAAKVTRAAATADSKSKALAAKVKLRARTTVKVKLKKEGGRIIVSNKAGKPVTKLRKIAERLHPNPKVTLYEKDPTFETSEDIRFVSSSAHSKLLIRAILLKDINMLESLMKDTQKICSLNTYRSVDIQLTPLTYAVLEEDHRAIRALLTVQKRKYANPPETLLEYQRSGRYNMTMLGHAVKPINVSRGGREGNNAFLKDMNLCDSTYPDIDDNLIKEALKKGVSQETLNLLFAENKDNTYAYSWSKDEIYKQLFIAVRNGHHKLAGQLVSEALECGGYGFNNLHKEALVNDRQPLTPFKTVSIIKKAFSSNVRITPLHCAAINPNPQYLTTLLSSTPSYDIADENGWRPIHYASVCKSTGPLELLISRNVSLEEPESEGNTPLQVAALAGRAHNVDLILRHLIASEHNKKETAITVSLQDKQCVNAIDRGNKKSYTALHIACQQGHTDVVRVLIRHKANVDKMTNAQHDKLTPLMLAAQKGHLDVVSLLIENNAQVEMKDKKQRTALTHAVINGHAHITSFLLRLGANPNSTDSSGNTLVHYAAAYGWYFCLQLLIEAGASLNLPNDWKITPLSLAFMKGHMGLVDHLVEQPGIDINVDVNNDSGMTLSMQALRSKINHSMLERIHFLVVKQKSDVTKVDFVGNNAFHHLVMAEVAEVQLETKAQQEHDALIQEITKLLLDHGCDPMVRNKEGESPFNLAVKEGCLLLVKMFLDAGCKLNLDVSQSGDNILHYLVAHARNRKVEPMLQAILNAKCSDAESTPHQLLCQMVKMYNKNGHTPLLQALNAMGSCYDEESQNRLLTFTKFLLEELLADVSAPCKDAEGKDTSYALHLGTKCKGGRVIEALLSRKPDLNCFDDQGQTPLILAIKGSNTEAVEALIKAGASVNLKSNDKDKISPLILAAKKPNLGKIVKLLVQNKADVNDVDAKNKNTALHYVVIARAPNVLETGKALIIAGADVNAVNDKLRTPLHLSINASESDSDSSYAIEECLLGFGAQLDKLDCRGRIPLHYAFTKIGEPFESSQIDPMELVVLLTGSMEKEKIGVADLFGQTVLHCAAYRGATISTMHLCKSFFNVKDAEGNTGLDVKDKDGNTALGLAVKNGHESCALMLLQTGANCIAEVVTPVHSKKDEEPHLEWLHVKKPPPVPQRHTILQETLLKDWQGILYLMLDQLDTRKELKGGINIAVEAALRTAKYNVALKLIGRIKNSWNLYSEKQSMLHVLAREAPADYLPELQVKVAQFLIEKGIQFISLDEHRCSVLTYAAVNRNYTLCSFFANKMSLPFVVKVDPDKSNRTPFSALFWKLTSEDLSEDIRNWCCSLLKTGANPNVLTNYPIVNSPYPGIRCTDIEALHVEDASAPKYSPLMMAIYKANFPIVKLLLSKGADVNFPDDKLRTPIMHAVRLSDIEALHVEDTNVPKYSPLMMAIYKANFSIVKLLLSKGADVNFPDDKLRTPIMHAVRLNDMKMVKLLLNYNYDPSKDKNPYGEVEPGTFQKTSPLNLSAQDANGWTVLHYLVDPLPDYCYSNTALLNFLAELGAPLEAATGAGETPLQMAARLQREVLVVALQKLMNMPEDQKIKIELSLPVPPSEDVQWDQPVSSYIEDSKTYLEKLESGKMDTDTGALNEPDPLSGFETTGEIVIDTEKDVPYDIVMTVVDLNYGAYGIYNFYKMQVIKHKGKDLFILFTCWGRVGDTGQHQKTPYSTLAEAVKEFCRIFRAKSGNSWEDVKNFTPQPKKYRLVQLERKKFHKQASIKINLKSDVPSKLSPEKQNLMDSLVSVHTINDTLEELGVVSKFDVLPLGSLSTETLVQAENILKEIGDVIAEKDNLRQNAIKSQEKFAELMHKIVKLSEQFYQLLPVYGFQCEKLCPLFSAPDVHSKLVLIHNLLHIGLASHMILGATHRVAEVNPKDYVYRSLNCNLSLLKEETRDAQMILQYIHNTSLSNSIHIHSIYTVHHGEQTGLPKLGNRMLLWHGTRLSNMLSVLTRGLQVAPLGAQMNGDLFGKGIYFADMFTKSQNYCVQHHSSKVKTILLCEVGLGDMKEVDYNLVVDPKEKRDSVKALGHKQPDPSKSVFWKGMTVPLGPPINALEHNSHLTSHVYLNFNEYVVYNADQVRIRYLVQFTD
ncbi:hypothetical protein JTE90_017793 [Oedothorax gibbosus]|uniref:Poly [ADP-ribose] polymerase n=1 Tax=Oedothorax gibbosus TaxID=931172 RepID=A0AAV6U673_9ARAC|nr:hypothetical protein JTE90_017793 [Oedothorax gibbosus]